MSSLTERMSLNCLLYCMYSYSSFMASWTITVVVFSDVVITVFTYKIKKINKNKTNFIFSILRKFMKIHEGEKRGEKTGEISPLHLNYIFWCKFPKLTD